jgi:hypothetical protein
MYALFYPLTAFSFFLDIRFSKRVCKVAKCALNCPQPTLLSLKKVLEKTITLA